VDTSRMRVNPLQTSHNFVRRQVTSGASCPFIYRTLMGNLYDPGSAGGSPALERAGCPRSQTSPSPIPPLPSESYRR
jgi:hypothetical protein